MIQMGSDICGNLDTALGKEWLETNGLGGFASSTVGGVNTRRYHGLLTAAIRPPLGRTLLLSKIEETLVFGDKEAELSSNEYPGVIHPNGYLYLKEFRLDPFPVFVYEVDEVRVTKTVFMVDGENTTVVEYEVEAPASMRAGMRLELRPLIAFRDYHGLAKENGSLRSALRIEDGSVSIAPYDGLPPLYLAHDADEVDTESAWYKNFHYRAERERGLDSEEDLFRPCTIVGRLEDRSRVVVIASTKPHRASQAAAYRKAEIERRNLLLDTLPAGAKQSPEIATLARAADQYIVRRENYHSVIAGYPWFGDWGRDTMISLPGLTLTTGRHEIARDIIDAFAKYVDRGMLPNRFPDAGEQPEYNTVDATLWYFEAIRAWLECTQDYAYAQSNWYALLCEIVEWHEAGTRHGIRLAPDGLLRAGEPGVQLTWMDAKVGDWVVTPRIGKPVEIQALWYNALCIMKDLADRFEDAAGAKKFADLSERARASFAAQFWNESAGCLYDVVADEAPDPSIRPNQIFAVSLPHTMLDAPQALRVVDVVTRDLLTPMGLRTLPQSDSRYVARYEGGVRERDGAYHQGTVWPWLLGPFIDAYVKVNGESPEARAQAKCWLEPMWDHLKDAGLGQISEIFDADAPHAPRGCYAQAWSVAELLRMAAKLERAAERPGPPRKDRVRMALA